MKHKIESATITGAGGFIGRHAAARFQSAGAKVSGVDLAQIAARDSLPGPEVYTDFKAGDITSPGLDKLLPAGQVYLHTAAVVSEDGDWDLFRRVNVDAAAACARQARRNGAAVFVHLSSVMVYGFNFPDQVMEVGPLDGADNPYCQTKIESEEAVLAEAGDGMQVVVIRPGDVYGPASVPWVTRPLALMKAGLFALPDDGAGYINTVYIDNLLDGIFLAIDRLLDGDSSVSGQAYNLTDGLAVTCRDYFTALAALADLKPPMRIPAVAGGLFSAALGAASWLHDIGLLKEDIAAEGLKFLQRPGAYSIEKARLDLGYSPAVSFEEGMKRTGEWITLSS